MKTDLRPDLLQRHRTLSRAGGALTLLLGALGLLGWMTDSTLLRSVFPGQVTMKVNTAVGLIVSGAALLLLHKDPPRRRAVPLLAAGVSLIGALTLSQYFFGWNLGIDELFIRDTAVAKGTSSPGRMSTTTSLCLILIGASLWINARGRPTLAQGMAAAVLMIGWMSLWGYLYGNKNFYNLFDYTHMALPTAVAFCLLATGLFLARPEKGPAALFSSHTLGGTVARRFGPLAFILPPVVGAVNLMGERAGYYNSAVGVALFSVVLIALCFGFTLATARALRDKDLGRRDAERALARQKHFLEAVLNSLGEGVVGADPQGRFTLWNPAAERIIGLGRADIPLEEWSQHYRLFRPDQTTPYPSQNLPLARALRGESVDNEELFLRAPQGEVWLSVTGRPLRDGEGHALGGVVVFSNQTERKRLEEENRTHLAHLKEANQELEAFSYSVSHDLRAPLRHVMGFADLLRRSADRLNDKEKHRLDMIREAAQQMGCLIDDLLAFSRVGRSTLTKTRVDVGRLMRETAERMGKESPERTLEIRIPPLPEAESDPNLIRLVVENLLSNAFKYTRTRNPARIEVEGRMENGEVVYAVRDNGVGFDMRYAHKLFGVFQRLHADNQFEGTGIGLANVKRIVTRHGGRTWAEGAVDAGATFYFSLPTTR